MKSRNWRIESVLACSIISLLACGLVGAQTPTKAAAIALTDGQDAAHWQAVAQQAGWQTIVPGGASTDPIDTRVLAVAAAVRAAIQNSGVDPARVYLAGRGNSAAEVFYTISRLPDVFAAGLAIGGSPQAALSTGRIYTVNFNNSPVLWVTGNDADEATAQKLKAAGMWMEWRSASETKNADVFAWLRARTHDPFPLDVDCETDSPTFATCFWLTPGKFDLSESNDVLPRTLVATAAPAALDMGAFGYKPDDPGPGVLISHLPEKYSGPLKMGDRITAINGHPIADAHEFQDLMTKATEEAARGGNASARQGADTRGDAHPGSPPRFRAHRARARQIRAGAEADPHHQPRRHRNARHHSRSVGRRQPVLERPGAREDRSAGMCAAQDR